jgi:hypothetical protein
MAVNYPGPYEIELKYVYLTFEHVLRINCDVQSAPSVGDDPSTITLETRDTAGIALDDAVDEITDLLIPLFEDATTFTSFNFWKYTASSFVKTFITSGDISKDGTFVGTNTLAGQKIYTCRTQEGGIFKMVLMEPAIGDSLITAYGSLGGSNQAVMDYICASDTWMLARDTSYPIVPLNACNGQNEKVFRQRYR